MVLIIAAYLILFFPKFQVKNIQISGNQNVATADIENTAQNASKTTLLHLGALKMITGSIFLASANSVADELLKQFPYIQTVQVQKNLPQTIDIKVQERSPYAVFCQDVNCFLLDIHGVIFHSLSNTPQDMMIVTNSANNQMPILGHVVVTPQIMNSISKIQEDLKNNFQISVTSVSVSDTLIFTTSEHWQLYIDPTSDINLQIVKLNALLNQQIKPADRKNLQYIYLQYKDRAYYK